MQPDRKRRHHGRREYPDRLVIDVPAGSVVVTNRSLPNDTISNGKVKMHGQRQAQQKFSGPRQRADQAGAQRQSVRRDQGIVQAQGRCD